MQRPTPSSDLQIAYGVALQHFNGGRFNAAELEIVKILAQQPHHSESLCLLGLIELARGHAQRAAELCCRAVEADPNNAQSHSGLGLALRALGRLDEAIPSLQRAAALKSGSAEIYNNLGIVFRDKGNLDEAVRCHRHAIALKPDYVKALSNLGIALAEQKHFDEAIDSYRRALIIDPNHAETYNNLGVAFESIDSPTKAEEHYCRAVTIKQDYAEAYGNLGLIQKKTGRPAEAEKSLLRALAIKPGNPEWWQLLGIVQKLQGRFDEAMQNFCRAVTLKPDYADAQFSLANAQLALGDFENGWRGYEWRLRTPWYGTRKFEQPKWAGEDLRGKTILICSEQGFGDVILFLRYAPLVAANSGFTIIEVPLPLARLASTLKGRGRVIALGDPLPRFDVYCPLLSLPALFRTTVSTIPTNVPYLFADPLLVERWREAMAEKPGFRVGLAWAGNPKQENDRYRSIAIEKLRPLLEISGIRWFSLQVGERASDVAALSPETITDVSDRLTDFAETAAVMAHLDLVITVDTAVAHLAGALGRPVWVMMSSIPDWRYLPGREDNAWYPTLRVFRKTMIDNWDHVISDVGKMILEITRR
jgi:tetratricopeptide (TPR) repeat protein